MANPEHVKVVRRGAEAIDAWRKAHPRTRLDLSGADLSAANLTMANLARADLSWANLTGASLADADLSGADLFRTNLFAADLDDANLTGANLTLARLENTLLTQAQFAQTRLWGTLIAECDLSGALGLESVKHDRPSTIGVDTILRSLRGAGNRLTPALEVFFLNAGVPQELLSVLPGILAEVKYRTAFVCYGEPDRAFAERLAADLKDRGVTSCWVYALDATPGERTWEEIGRKRKESEKMIVLCSAPALIRPGVLKEIEEQIDEDPGKMVPISLDNLWKEEGFPVKGRNRDLKPFLLDKNWADFRNRRRYKQSLDRLLTALERQDR